MPLSLHSPWRADFPALAAFDAEHQTYLDNAATAQKPKAMLEALAAYYSGGVANVHRAGHGPAARATGAFESTRAKVAHWLNAPGPANIVFTHGATSALNLLAYGLEHEFKPGDQVVISALEHHANLLPWQRLAERRGLELVVLPLLGSGVVDLDAARLLIGPGIRLLAISQLSNVLGVWQPLPELLAMAHQHGALTIIDGAQGAVHGRNNVQAMGCDYYVLSSHKVYGSDGVGVLYGKTDALARLRHWQFGGEMVRAADYHTADFHPAPLGFEAGTPPIAGVIGLGASLDYLQAQNPDALTAHEAALHGALLDGLASRPLVRVLGEPRTALATFVVEGVHHADLAALLSEQGVAVRAGQHCAMPLFKHLGVAGAVRVSLAMYNDGADLTRFFDALDQSLAVLS